MSKVNAIAIFCIGRRYPSYHLQEHAVSFVASSNDKQLLAELLQNSDDACVSEQHLILRGLSTNASLKEVLFSLTKKAMAVLKDKSKCA